MPISDEEYTRKRKFFEQIGYKPHKSAEEIHRDSHSVIQIAGGERWGKSLATSAEGCYRMFIGDMLAKYPNEEYWLVAADYDRNRAEWGYLSEFFRKLGFLRFVSKRLDPGQMIVGFKGVPESQCIRIYSKSANDPLKLATTAPRGIIGCEFSQVDRETKDRCIGRLLEKRGWFIMSGCLAGDTLIATDQGLREIGQLVGDITRPVDIGVSGLQEKTPATLAFYNGETETIKVSLARGMKIEGTPNHKVVARLSDGSVEWIELQNLTYDTLVAIRYDMNLWGTGRIENPYLLGLYLAEGCCEKSDRFTFTNGDEPIGDYLQSLGFIKDRQRGIHYRLTNHPLADYYRAIGVDLSAHATTKQIPIGVLSANKEDVISVLQGMYDGDGCATKRGVVYYTSSYKMAQQVQMLLLNLGIVSCLNGRTCKLNGKEYPSFSVITGDSRKFAEIVGFRLDRKQANAKAKNAPSFFRNQALTGSSFMGYPVIWAGVEGKEKGFARTYDLHVPDGHAYWANGLIVHNTFESSLGWYAEDWKYWQSENADDAKSYSKPTWENRVIFPQGRNDPAIKRLEGQMSRERFMERHGGIPCPPAGSVFANYFANRTHVKDDLCVFDEDQEVFIWVDPGYTHANVVEAVQIRDGSVFIIDEIYTMGLVTGGGAGVINAFKQKPWAKNVKRGTADYHANDKRAEGNAVSDVWQKEAGVTLTWNKVDILPGIEVFKTYLMPNPITNEPKIFMHSKCRGLISELGGCLNPLTGRAEVWAYQVDKEGKVVGEKPKPVNDDACKAVIYGLVDMFGYAKSKPFNKKRKLSPYRLVTK